MCVSSTEEVSNGVQRVAARHGTGARFLLYICMARKLKGSKPPRGAVIEAR